MSSLFQIVPGLVVMPLYFAGTLGLGEISQSSDAFNHVLNDMSIIVDHVSALQLLNLISVLLCWCRLHAP
jgi:ABC-type uncharacterized transport system fused permease/ATPase subunit